MTSQVQGSDHLKAAQKGLTNHLNGRSSENLSRWLSPYPASQGYGLNRWDKCWVNTDRRPELDDSKKEWEILSLDDMLTA